MTNFFMPHLLRCRPTIVRGDSTNGEGKCRERDCRRRRSRRLVPIGDGVPTSPGSLRRFARLVPAYDFAMMLLDQVVCSTGSTGGVGT